MALKLGALQKVVNEEKAVAPLRSEISRAFGPSVVTEGNIVSVAAAANDRIDVLERTGRSAPSAHLSIMMKFVNHESSEVRRLVARLLPESFVRRMVNDKSRTVRLAVAKRVPIDMVLEMVRSNPRDDEMMYVFKTRRLAEAVKLEPSNPTPLDIYGEERLGDAVKQPEGPELSDQWYEDKAKNLIQDYGQNIEGQWEEIAVNRFCSSLRATSGVEVDSDKLLKALMKVLEEKDDRSLERTELKELARRLREEDTGSVVLSESEE